MNQIQKMVSDLIESGNTQLSIAQKVKFLTKGECSQSTISRIHKGDIANPRWNVANAIQDIHKQLKQSTKRKPHATL